MKFNAGHPPLLLNIIKSSYVAYLPPRFSSCRVRVLPSARSARGTKACGSYSEALLYLFCMQPAALAAQNRRLFRADQVREGQGHTRSVWLLLIQVITARTITRLQNHKQWVSQVLCLHISALGLVMWTRLNWAEFAIQSKQTRLIHLVFLALVQSHPLFIFTRVCVHADGKQLKDAMIRFKQQTSYETVKTAWKSHFRCLRWYLWVYWWHHFDPV